MRIQHNIAALNAHRYLSSNNDAVAKNLEKLSSGYRINRAGDDAAGLSISEKMRAQITGLETAKKNAQDGVSLVQTAEGNLTEVHSMLNRMVELSTQAANGTYQDLNRTEIQKEITSLTSEIDRISSSANFNGIKLLDGSLATGAAPTVKDATVNGTPATPTPVDAVGSTFKGLVGDTQKTGNVVTIAYEKDGQAATTTVTFDATTTAKDNAAALKSAIENNADLKDQFDITTDNTGNITLTSRETGSKAIKVTGMTSANTGVATDAATTKGGEDAGTKINLDAWKAADHITVNGKKYTGLANLDALKGALKKDGIVVDGTGADTVLRADPDKAGLMLQIGESNDDYQQVRVSVGKMDSKSLGLADLDLTSQNGALAAIDVVTKAIDTVSGTRGTLGAIQNRLEHTINNLSVTDENMTAAESRIRDVDMAKEMMDFTKNNILTQAAQSMLAQANTLPQGVLQLLR